MNIEIIYTDILKKCETYAKVKDGVLYVLLKEELRNDKERSDLLVSEIIRRLLK